MRLICLFAAAACVARAGSAQSTPPTAVPEGTELHAVTATDLSSKTAAVGDPVNLKIDEPVMIDGRIAIAKGRWSAERYPRQSARAGSGAEAS